MGYPFRMAERIEQLDDPRIAAFRHVRDRELIRRRSLFIAEGEHLVRRLLESGWAVESVLVTPAKLDVFEPIADTRAPLYVADEPLVQQIVGYRFHRGVIAAGRRPTFPSVSDVIGDLPGRATLLVCPEINDAENLGSLIRIAGAFGVDAMILGERCSDPLYRRTVRVSMGAVFSVPIAISEDLLADLDVLGEADVELIATVTDDDAEPLSGAARRDRLALLVGSEGEGLHRRFAGVCDRRVTIPMSAGADSLNVAVATAVFLHHFQHNVR